MTLVPIETAPRPCCLPPERYPRPGHVWMGDSDLPNGTAWICEHDQVWIVCGRGIGRPIGQWRLATSREARRARRRARNL